MIHNRSILIDMWYGNSVSESDKIDILFYPNAGQYRGNIYKDGKIIGDYVCENSIELQKAFSHLRFDFR